MSPRHTVVRLARWLLGTPAPVPPARQRADASLDAMPAFIPDSSPLDDPSAAELRACHALMLMDPDVYGYLMLTVHRQSGSLRAELRATEQIEPSWRPAVREALIRLAAAQCV